MIYGSMKKLLISIFVCCPLLFGAELTHVAIGKQDFSIVMEEYDIYDSKGEVMKLYKEERNNDLTFILSHTLYDITGNCGDKTIQEGAYEINGTDITLYSFWDRRGRMYEAPYGARVSHYQVLDDHSVVKKSSYIYVESERKNHTKESPMKYLFTPPVTEDEKEALKGYIKEMEEKYKGKFVFEDEAKKLIDSVKEAIRKKIKKRWRKN